MKARTRTEQALRRAGLVALLWALAASTPAASSLRVGLGAATLPTPEGGPLAGYGGLLDRPLADNPQIAIILHRVTPKLHRPG